MKNIYNEKKEHFLWEIAMRTIRISDEVWEEIAKQGKFGETEDDVLRRVFGLDNRGGLENQGSEQRHLRPRRPRRHHATRRMHAGVHRVPGAEREHLVVSFQDGPERRWELPDPSDKVEIRKVRKEAVEFALENGASKPGQTNAVLKALTDAGYYVTK